MAIETISRPIIGPPPRESFIERSASALYDRLRSLRRRDQPNRDSGADRNARAITLVCISDTHNTRPGPLPPGDILIHAGDLSQFGTFAEIQAQLTWLASQPYQHKVVIAGNHDLLLDPAFCDAHPDRELGLHPGQHRSDLDWGDIKYLEHESLDVHVYSAGRSVRIFGSPYTPRCGNWAFQYPSARKGKEPDFSWTEQIPDAVDVLVVHGPPKGHLDDGGKGCSELLVELQKASPKIVVCGHIHAGRGEEWLWFDQGQSLYDNIMMGNRPELCLVGLTFNYLWGAAWSRIGIVTQRKHGGRILPTRLVNAAMVGGRYDRDQRQAVTITL